MADKSAIEWTDATWNPVTGCSKVSPGCAHCYAEREAMTRLKGKPGYPGLPWTPENAETNVVLHPDRLDQPLRWRKPRMIFTCSMSDLFHEQIPDEYLDRVFAVMAWAHRHVFQVLTKRPQRMRDYLSDPATERRIEHAMCDRCMVTQGGLCGFPGEDCGLDGAFLPLENVWLGTSIENRRYVHRADILRDTPAAVRFISAEPLLGPLVGPPRLDIDGNFSAPPRDLDLAGIQWLIVGGESGPKHRPMRAAWARDLRDVAEHCGTAFFFKQWGGRTPKAGGRELDGRTWDEMPTTWALERVA